MTLLTLRQLFSEHAGKVADKWEVYLDVYEEIFSSFRDSPVRFLEIGVQNGGSLEIWSKFFAHAKLIVGCDVDAACGTLKYDDPRVQVVIGDANDASVRRKILEHSVEFDIILDDGSHRSADVVSSFSHYFSHLKDGGIYVVEDLHCSYWARFQGGLFAPQSSISFFKQLADVVNFEHWGTDESRIGILRDFSQAHGCDFTDSGLDHIQSVEFRNSLCIVRKNSAARGQLGRRMVAGTIDGVSTLELPLKGRTRSEIDVVDESGNEWSSLPAPLESKSARALRAEVEARTADLLEAQARELARLMEDHERQLAEYTQDRQQFELSGRRQQRELAALKRRYEALSNELKAAQDLHAALLASRSWQAVMALRRIAARFPRLSRWSWKLAKAARLLATLQFRQVYQVLQHRYRAREIATKLLKSRLFDAGYYAATYPDVSAFPGGPIRHYVLRGAAEGRNPHSLFMGQWYLSNNPHLAAQRINPLLHYLQNSHLNPNPFFDGQWYLDIYPDVRNSGINPLVHYHEFGAKEGRDPSARFSTEWYSEQNSDLLPSGTNPLAHFLSEGQAMGRSPSVDSFTKRIGFSVMQSEIRCLKTPERAREVALFVAHSPDGRLKPHVQHYLESLRKGGIAVTLIVAADAPFDPSPELVAMVSGIFVRRNEGYDFAAWAHVLRLRPDLLDAELLYLLNDSLIGPFNSSDFERLLAGVRDNPAVVVGLTANHERAGWHLQSYFLALKKKALASVAFQSFFHQVTTLDDKDDVINQYELRFAPYLRAAGLECTALFASDGPSNPTIYDWHGLIDRGFPFVKVMVLRDRFEGVDISGWQDVLQSKGFDPDLAARTLEEARRARPPSPVQLPLSHLVAKPFDLPPVPVRVALIAPWNFDNGLGVASRSYISALRRSGFLLNLHPIKRPFHVHRQIAPAFDVCDFAGDADVALVQLNPDGWDSMFTDAQAEVIRKARVRIGLWVWETPQVPPAWLQVMSEVDAIWAPSQYCADAFSAAVDVPVHVVPYVVALRPASDADSRSALAAASQLIGAAGDAKIILYAFDGSSYLVRKNPFALINAFGKSRLHEKGWTLVLKTKHVFDSPAQGNALAGLVARVPGVHMINRSLDKDSMAALMAAATIYASPHCAEGFGLTVAEAMAMGKLVVATNYSGTCDFMDADSGFPVGYEMRALEDTHGAYGTGSTWASIDEDQLADALAAAADKADAGDAAIGEAARRRIQAQLSAQAVAERMKSSLSQLLPMPALGAPGGPQQ